MRYQFDEVTVDVDRFEVIRDGASQRIEPQVFDVLVHLIRHRERLVTKEELLDTVWGDRFVSESALSSRIKMARQAIGDDGTRQAHIKTIHGRGFRFIAAITELVDPTVAADGSPTPDDGFDGAVAGRSGFARPGALPADVPQTSFVGRDDDVANVRALLADRRLVTVCGAGGVGKTRLALEVVRETATGYRDGAHVVELAGVDSASDVVAKIGSELGVQERVGAVASERIVESFRSQQVLLVLDNCEHVSESIRPLIEALMTSTGVTMLATSRRPLGVEGEHLWTLSPLPLVAAAGETPEAVQLFLDRARAAAPHLVVDDATISDIESVCSELDGIPLLIELAAARVRHVGLRGLREALNDPAVIRPTRRSADRHRSVDALLQWSFGPLSTDEQRVLCGVASFAGWFDLAGAQSVSDGVVDDVRPALWHLIDESLVIADVNRPAAPYRLLRPIRAFGRRQLDTDDATRVANGHADWTVETVAASDASLRTATAPEGMRRPATMVPDIELAYRTLVATGRREAMERLFGGLFVFVQETHPQRHRPPRRGADRVGTAREGSAVGRRCALRSRGMAARRR